MMRPTAPPTTSDRTSIHDSGGVKPQTHPPPGGGGGGLCTVCGLYFAGSCFDPATAAFLAVAAATASTTTTVPCPWAHSLVCVRCRTSWERKTKKSWKKYRRATQTKKVTGGRMVQCTTCAVWQAYATEFYKKDKRQYESTGKITCGTCRRLQCKSKLTGLPPPPAMATRGLPPSAAGATPVARETSPYYAYAPPDYYAGAAGPQTHTTQTQNTPSPFLGHHPDPTNDYYYHYQQQPQSLPAAPVYDHYYAAPAPSYRHNEQVPTTTTTQYSSHRNPDGREEEEGGGGWNAATTQLQQQQQQSRNNVTRTE